MSKSPVDSRRPPRRAPAHTSPHLGLGRSKLAKLLASGTVKPPGVTTAALQRLRPVDRAITIHSGTVARGAALRNLTLGLPGFRFQVPAPDANRTLLWVSMGFDWFFNGWQSSFPKNTGSSSKRIEGSLRWLWYLTGHPQIFADPPILLSDSDGYEFYTTLPPGGAGFDVGWLTRKKEGVFTDVPDKQDPENTSPLQRLLSLKQGTTLELWFAMDIQDQTPSGGFIMPWGPNTLCYTYAYAELLGGIAAEPWTAG
jgi:hypothetical protein